MKLTKEQLLSIISDNTKYVYGICKASDLDKIDVECAVKKYDAGQKTYSRLPGAKTVIVIGSVITKEMDVMKKGLLKDDFPCYKDSRERAVKIVDILHKYGYQAKTSIGISIKNACVLAGIGQYGKNALIINPKYGTRLRFCTVLTDWEPECYDKPIDFEPCKDCDEICIKSCKGNCLTPYVIDGLKCMCTYIEKDMKPLATYTMCSICQDVCKWNQF